MIEINEIGKWKMEYTIGNMTLITAVFERMFVRIIVGKDNPRIRPGLPWDDGNENKQIRIVHRVWMKEQECYKIEKE